MKGQLACIMEGVEHLLEQGFVPSRDIYIAIGHDEESMGTLGAQRIVNRLVEKDVHLDFVIDEGGAVMDGKILGISAMVAAVGIAEKGYADVRLTVRAAGGHASRPPRETAVGILAKAIVAIEKHQMKSSLNQPLRNMLDVVGGYMKFPLNVITANLFITKPLLLKGLSAGSMGAAMVHTTAAPTMLRGSSAPNVLADCAEAVVNFRISPGETLEDVLQHIRSVTHGRVEMEVIQGHNPSPVSPVDTEGYRVITRTIRELFDGHVITPYLGIAAADARWYAPVADGVYRFQPFRSMSEDLHTLHAVGERLSVESLCEGTAFFIQLVKNANE
jgi:carboxypeptidase PM20D1